MTRQQYFRLTRQRKTGHGRNCQQGIMCFYCHSSSQKIKLWWAASSVSKWWDVNPLINWRFSIHKSGFYTRLLLSPFMIPYMQTNAFLSPQCVHFPGLKPAAQRWEARISPCAKRSEPLARLRASHRIQFMRYLCSLQRCLPPSLSPFWLNPSLHHHFLPPRSPLSLHPSTSGLLLCWTFANCARSPPLQTTLPSRLPLPQILAIFIRNN